MSWSIVKMGSFLKERKMRFKPNDIQINGLKRIDKIDFSGNIFLSEKASNTDMILIKERDLVISGINVTKGAMAVYQGNKDVIATIHYSSYEYDETKIDIQFLKHFLKSPEFVNALKEQIPGGIKTEIKPKHLLPLEVKIPLDIIEQRKIVSLLDQRNENVCRLSDELTHQLTLVKQLRQSFLREAMQGKLTAEFRSANPELIVGENSAQALLEKIKAEKKQLIKDGKLKKEKELAPVSEDEIPFEIPESWRWCRLEACGDLKRGKSKHRPRNDERLFRNGTIPFIQTGDVARSKTNSYIINTINGYYNDFGLTQSEMQKRGTLCITIAANIAECGFLGFDACAPDSIVCFNSIDESVEKYIFYYIIDARDEIEKYAPATAQKNINLGILNSLIIPFPPLSEQQAIVSKLDELMRTCDELEASIRSSQKQNEMLLQQVLREALEKPEEKSRSYG